MTKMLNFKIIIEQDEDGYFVASIPSVPGCYSQGKTYEDVIKNVKEALELSLEIAKDNKTYAQKISFPETIEKESFLGIANLPIRFAY
jgi:predicted RNase H-like HicB family nuclease